MVDKNIENEIKITITLLKLFGIAPKCLINNIIYTFYRFVILLLISFSSYSTLITTKVFAKHMNTIVCTFTDKISIFANFLCISIYFIFIKKFEKSLQHTLKLLNKIWIHNSKIILFQQILFCLLIIIQFISSIIVSINYFSVYFNPFIVVLVSCIPYFIDHIFLFFPMILMNILQKYYKIFNKNIVKKNFKNIMKNHFKLNIIFQSIQNTFSIILSISLICNSFYVITCTLFIINPESLELNSFSFAHRHLLLKVLLTLIQMFSLIHACVRVSKQVSIFL